MEATNISVLEHEKKENNIPPFSTSKKPGPSEEKGEPALVKRKWRRKPLRDVTNFYREAELRGLNPTMASPVLASVFSSSRKRKLVDDGEEQRPFSKILRREYR
ncbi:hypothetical protein AAHA92_11354 [Salvia divinorum]|uniref:Uncharacterized protein n=1 Tax=Salvia divinorum TaxID=28513 RepID=A0ABD1HHC7_SALDI